MISNIKKNIKTEKFWVIGLAFSFTFVISRLPYFLYLNLPCISPDSYGYTFVSDIFSRLNFKELRFLPLSHFSFYYGAVL